VCCVRHYILLCETASILSSRRQHLQFIVFSKRKINRLHFRICRNFCYTVSAQFDNSLDTDNEMNDSRHGLLIAVEPQYVYLV
jgi:hypothetical protein